MAERKNDDIDFDQINQDLQMRGHDLVHEWLPGGKIVGREYWCGSIHGGSGKSFKWNMDKGVGGDFGTNEMYADWVSLYAGIKGLGQVEAAKELRDIYLGGNPVVVRKQPLPPKKLTNALVPPPKNVGVPQMRHQKFGAPSAVYCYRDPKGQPLTYVARYENGEGKTFLPWSYSDVEKCFIKKAWHENRPIYGLDLLAQSDCRVMIVEGEKTCEAARKIVGEKYTVVTWQGGSGAVSKTNWSPVHNRDVLIWPDADTPGIKATRSICEKLHKRARSIRYIDPGDKNSGWDAADALAEGWDFPKLVAWAKPRAKTYDPEPEVLPPDDEVPLEAYDDQPEVQDPGTQNLWQDLKLHMASAKKVANNTANVLKILHEKPPIPNLIWYDEFYRKYFTMLGNRGAREWIEADDVALLVWIQNQFEFIDLTISNVRQALLDISRQKIRNEPKDWMQGLSWDGVERCRDFFAKYMGAPATPFNEYASRNWWTSIAARVFKPGCKVDNMVILWGPQGIYKSSALDLIGGKWFTEIHEAINNKDFYQAIQGKLLVEVSELASFTKADTNKLKQVISCRTDRFRESYGRVTKDWPRQCVFVGTTNEGQFSKDATGARRFWRVKCGTIDLEAITRDREQLFAEAVNLFQAGEKWWVMPSDAAKEQDDYYQTDEWEYEVATYIDTYKLFGVTVKDVAKGLGIELDRLGYMEQKRIRNCLTRLGWETKPKRIEDGTVAKRWVPKDG